MSTTTQPVPTKPKAKPKTREEVLQILLAKLDECIAVQENLRLEQELLRKKFRYIRKVVTIVLSVDEGHDDFKMAAEIPFDPDEPEEVEYDNVVYKRGDVVELYDSKAKRWTTSTGKLMKFCPKMAKIMPPGPGKTMTSRKYGYFRFPAGDNNDANVSG